MRYPSLVDPSDYSSDYAFDIVPVILEEDENGEDADVLVAKMYLSNDAESRWHRTPERLAEEW